MPATYLAGLSRVTIENAHLPAGPAAVTLHVRDADIRLPGEGEPHFVQIRGLLAPPPDSAPAPADLPARLALVVLGGDEAAVWPLIDALLESRERR